MKTREEQIAEMTSEVKNFKNRTRFLFGWDGRAEDEIFATLLLDAGYRKQSDTVGGFVGKVLKIGSKRPLCLFNEYGEGYIDCIENIKKIAKEYGVEVEK